ncbi:MAG: hypothetical protein KDJ15_07855, partial [Alphaproteobacteria bacterium]|nr:hypothetical protein [Alphaproteobacteria bacterium]
RLDGDINESVARLESCGDMSVSALTQVRESLEKTACDFEPLFDSAMEKAVETRLRFEELHNGFSTSTRSTLDRVQAVGGVFDERLETLRSGAEEASALIVDAGDFLRAQSRAMDNAVREAHEQTADLRRTLDNQTSDIHLLTDEALLKIKTVQKAVNDQFHELSESVGQARTQIETVGQEVLRTAEKAGDGAAQVTEKLEGTARKALDHTDKLVQAARKSAEVATDLVARIQGGAQTLADGAKDTLLDLKKTGDSFALRAQEVEAQMKASLNTSRSYGEELRRQAGLVAEASSESATQIAQAVTRLSGTMSAIQGDTDSLVTKIGESRTALASESDRLLTVSAAAVKAGQDAADSFGRQSSVLFKAVDETARSIERMAAQEGRMRRDSFMSSAKFIVESLHSLS